MKKTQSGFALIESLLIVLILVIIGFGGYYVWHTQKQTDKTLDAAASTSQKAATTEASNASSQKYLTIKEWGVRLTLPSDNSTLYYIMKSEVPNTAYLGFHKIDAIAPQCAADKTSVGAIFRQTPEERQDAVDNPSGVNPPANTRIGDYYYGFLHPQAACTDGSASMDEAVQKAEADQDVRAIFQTIEAVQ